MIRKNVTYLALGLALLSVGCHFEDERRSRLSDRFHDALSQYSHSCPDGLDEVWQFIEEYSGTGLGCYPSDEKKVERCVSLMNELTEEQICRFDLADTAEIEGVESTKVQVACSGVYPECNLAF
jgi:hypothetical protein